MGLQEKQLGQSRPASTAVVSLYSPPASTTAIVRSIFVCNTTGSSAAYRIFVDDDGTTYDQTTALFYDVTIAAATTVVIDVFLAMHQDAGNLAVRTDTLNALNFTCFGAEIT